MKSISVIAGLAISLAVSAAAETYRLGAWNIQDLHHQEGFSLRSFNGFGSVKRTKTDFDLLAKYRDAFGADAKAPDVVALQEIGTQAALDRLFPSSDWISVMSPRWIDDTAPEGEGDVYTAIAVRRASGIEIVEVDHLPGLSILHTDGRPTRAATGALLKLGDQQMWFLSVHLKSSCSSTTNAHMSTNDDCETLWKQVPILANWIDVKRATGIPIVIAGDFNRRFRQFQDEGPVWKALNGVEPDEDMDALRLTKHPLSVTRLCPTRKGTSTQPIDWIVLDEGLSDAFVPGSFFETRFERDGMDAAQSGLGLSDHCPISIDITFE